MEFNPFFVDFLAVLFLIISAIVFCLAFKHITNDKLNKVVYTIFSCLFISYPIISEIFVYTPAGLTIALCYFGIAISANLICKYLDSKKIRYLAYISIILTLCIKSYESFASVYLCTVFIVFILDYIYNNEKEVNLLKTIITIIKLLIPLVIAIVFGKIIAVMIIHVFNITENNYAAKELIDFSQGIGHAIKRLVKSLLYNFVMKGLVYLPITILSLSMICSFIMGTIYAIKRKSITIFLLFLGVLFSLIALSIIQGCASPNRTCQVFAIFIAFTFMILAQATIKSSLPQIIKNIVLIFIFIIVFYQAKELHKAFYLNYLRYQEEKKTITTIADDLQKNYDTNKPIIFLGSYEIPEFIKKQFDCNEDSWQYKIALRFKIDELQQEEIITQTTIKPYLNWGMYAFGEPATEVFKWLEMLGYDLKQGTLEMRQEATEKEKELKEYPEKGYILETENYIIVNL